MAIQIEVMDGTDKKSVHCNNEMIIFHLNEIFVHNRKSYENISPPPIVSILPTSVNGRSLFVISLNSFRSLKKGRR